MGNEPVLDSKGPASGSGSGSGAEQPSVNGVSALSFAESVPVRGSAPADSEAGGSSYNTTEVNGADRANVKKRRGRPPKVGGPSVAPVAKRTKMEEEDVCFICFDGGSLVLCDRRDCPKAYHPACVKRDESFFTPRLRWNCGWHLCNSCQKNALFMCYTCPYSLCKTCVKQADIFCVRGNKGFCKTCMTTISLIEKIKEGSSEEVHVDFDDPLSWEYLFKVYWVILKQKESLTLDELTKATNPWKGHSINHVNNHVELSMTTAPLETNNDQVETNVSKRRKTRKQLPMQNNTRERIVTYKLQESAVEWASKELLEFVSYVKNGDTSKLTQFEFQALLLEYIKKNKLRDPRRKCQITCDKRLEVLFGKARLDHFEMLKLLECHFKDGSCASSVVLAAAIDSSTSEMKLEECSEESNIVTAERTRQTPQKVDKRARQINLNNFAAIDVHNMSLIYLRRNLMDNLLEDAENFHDKVVGSVVRIRISDNEQEMYRLVQVVGTGRAAEPYKVGDKTSHVILKILNLDKIEDVRIDAISNQDLSEDECVRLRQNVKCGLVERMTVGEVQKKAIGLREVKIKDDIEAEILKLNQLRDRASEMGHRKELREYAEKLELLRSSEERIRRMHEIPEVHADPRMDPMYQSDEDSEQSATKQDVSMTPIHSISNSSVELIARSSSSNCDLKRNVSDRSQISKEDDAARSLESSQSTLELEKNAARILEELRNQGEPCRITSKHEVMTLVNHPRDASDASVTSSSRSVLSRNNTEFEKIWHYQDPSGNVQGPFCMLQLRKWNSDGYFPTDLRIWRIDESQDKSVLLTDALSNQCSEDQFQSDCLDPHEARFVSDRRNPEHSGQISININAAWTNDKPHDGCNSDLTDAVRCSDDKTQPITGQNIRQAPDMDSSSQVSPEENLKSSPVASFPAEKVSNTCFASKDTVCQMMDQNHKPECSDPPSVTPNGCNQNSKCVAIEPGLQFSDPPSSSINLEADHENFKGQEENEIIGDMKCKAEEHNQPVSVIVPEQNEGNNGHISSVHTNFTDLPSQSLELNNEETKSQEIVFKEPVASYMLGQDSFTSWHALSSEIGASVPVSQENQKTDVVKGLATELSLSSNPACQDIGFSWNSTPCVVDLDSGIKFGDHATSTATGNCQFTHSLTSQIECNTSGWPDGLIELSTLGDESVSDLLSEVEAMESLHGLPSPNLRIDFGDDPIGSPSNDCFSPLMIDKHDTWNSTCDLQFRSQATITDSLNLHDCPTNPFNHRVKEESVSDQQDFLSLTCTSVASSMPAVNSFSFEGLHPPTSLSLSTMDSCSVPKMEIQAKLNEISNSLNLEFEPLLANTRSWDGMNPARVSAGKNAFASPVNLPPGPQPSLPPPAIPAFVSSPMEQGQMKLGYADVAPFPLSAAPSSTLNAPSSPVEEGEVEPASLSLELSVNVHSPKDQFRRKISSFGEEGKAKSTADASISLPTNGSSPRDVKASWTANQGTQTSGNHRSSAHSTPNQANRASQQPRHLGGSGRHYGHIDLGPGFLKPARPAWSRQSSFNSGSGSGGVGGFQRQPPPSHRSQRICKFFESGYCKKGSSCHYLHP